MGILPSRSLPLAHLIQYVYVSHVKGVKSNCMNVFKQTLYDRKKARSNSPVLFTARAIAVQSSVHVVRYYWIRPVMRNQTVDQNVHLRKGRGCLLASVLQLQLLYTSNYQKV